MNVKLKLTDDEATELAYAINYRVNSLKAPAFGCSECSRLTFDRFCKLHQPMVDTLLITLKRLADTRFNHQS